MTNTCTAIDLSPAIEFLDSFYGDDWVDWINLNNFDINDPYKCICFYMDEDWVLFKLKIRDHIPDDYHAERVIDLFGRWCDSDLNDAWKAYIEDRQDIKGWTKN
jgi:hypothetical protein